jgi:hypothetical protein
LFYSLLNFLLQGRNKSGRVACPRFYGFQRKKFHARCVQLMWLKVGDGWSGTREWLSSLLMDG